MIRFSSLLLPFRLPATILLIIFAACHYLFAVAALRLRQLSLRHYAGLPLFSCLSPVLSAPPVLPFSLFELPRHYAAASHFGSFT